MAEVIRRESMRFLMIVAALGLAMPVSAQSKLSSKQRKRDAFSELNAKRKTDQGSDAGLALRFFDALTGEPLRGAKVSADGESVMTNGEGRALLKWPAKLNKREDRRIVRVSKSGYVTSDIEVHFMAGTIFNNRFSISPALSPDRLRVVLDWGSSPADLDAHLIKQKRGRKQYHISYREMKSWRDVARLDRDDTDAFGPETITIDRVDARGDYTFVVHDYTNHHTSNAADMYKARATVQLYMDGQLKAQFRPPRGRGNLWSVFVLRAGKLTTVNKISRLR
jgi:hypothetical protein